MFDYVSDRDKLLLDYPASWWRNMWREALPAGNGIIGAAVYGAVHNETILINHSQLWHMGKKDELPDVSHTLQATRKLMEQGEFEKANGRLANELKQTGYSANLANPLPLVDLNVRMFDSVFFHYQRGINMTTGEVGVTWKSEGITYLRKLFVSHSDDTLIYHISSDQTNQIDTEIGFSLHPTDTPHLQERYKEISENVKIELENTFLSFTALNDDGKAYGAVAYVQTNGGKVSNKKGMIQCKSANEIIVLIKIFVYADDREKECNKLKEQLIAFPSDYQSLLNNHLSIYQPLYHSASLELTSDQTNETNERLLMEAYHEKASIKLMEKMWSYGRYLFISGTSVKGQPFSMYGLWHGDYRLMWSHRMANENIQMMYWHTNVGGLKDYNCALIEYYLSLIDDFRDNAKKLYGCRGIYIPAASTPGIGQPTQIVPVILNWTSAAGWIAQHFYQYYQFSADRRFLENKILPFMREIAYFYQDFLMEGSEGYYQYYPSVSPENTPGNFMPESDEPVAHPMPTAKNATMDYAVMKELLTNLIEASKALSKYQEEITMWKTMLSKIPPYKVNGEGMLMEWMDEQFCDNNQHRHLSHMYPIFPGSELIDEEEKNLFEACCKAVDNRKLGAQTSWSFAHMSCIYARLGESESALGSLDLLMRSCLLPNFYTLHNDWRNMGLTMNINYAPVQLEANMGIVNAIQEMLCYVSSTKLKVLPALPKGWNTGKVNNFRFSTGEISFKWNRTNSSLSIKVSSIRDTNIQLILPLFCEKYLCSDKEMCRKATHNSYQLVMPEGKEVYIFSN